MSSKLEIDEEAIEDPGQSWVELVMALKAKNDVLVKQILGVASTSNWTEELWDELTLGYSEPQVVEIEDMLDS